MLLISIVNVVVGVDKLLVNRSETVDAIRIRFSALEGLRSWMSYDNDIDDTSTLFTSHARTSSHWKKMQQQTMSTRQPEDNNIHDVEITSTSYDYTYTTPYKGGTDCITMNIHDHNDDGDDDSEDEDEDDMYDYLRPDSSSFIPKHLDIFENNPNKNKSKGVRGTNIVQQRSRSRVKLRKPLCKCKGDGGRAPFVSVAASSPSTNNTNRKKQQQQRQKKKNNGRRLPQQPEWKKMSSNSTYTVDIEGLLRRNPGLLYRSKDIMLWEDDLHDNGTAWLKVRTFVCREGWACLLRNYIRIDQVLVRVIDTRYIHLFGTPCIYREHSWKEGTWQELLTKKNNGQGQQGNGQQQWYRSPNPNTDYNNNNNHHHHHSHYIPDSSSSISLEAINDSIAAKYLPLKEPPITEYLSLPIPRTADSSESLQSSLPLSQLSLQLQPSSLLPSVSSLSSFKKDKDTVEVDTNQQQQQQQRVRKDSNNNTNNSFVSCSSLLMINDPTIEDAIPVTNNNNNNNKNKNNITFILQRSNEKVVEAISTTRIPTTKTRIAGTTNSNNSVDVDAALSSSSIT